MGVPATTGQLCTRVQDMEVGDYIASGVIGGNNGSVVTFTSSLFYSSDSAVVDEVPIGGASNLSTWMKFYYVKVAKGLLVADRVLQHSISWDVLNNNKCIQGNPVNSRNIVPAMTSNTSPSGIASASSTYSVKEAYRAFNKTTNDSLQTWTSNTGVAWLAYEFPQPTIVRGYSLKVVLTGEAPKTWTFEGWDGSKWVILDSRSNITFTANAKQSFLISNAIAYIKYRINISAGVSASYISIDELEMFETAGIIRSLTGGVAHADMNGDKSTTNQGFGGWPTNNEWDRYIVNFPQDKIQTGKTLDDVFHCLSAGTWCQDTPVSNSTSRVFRGGWNVSLHKNNSFSSTSSSQSSGSLGFRPVFSYKE